MRNIIVILILNISSSLFTQTKKIFGSVSDNVDVMGNVNVYNVNSKGATITNDIGEFEVFVNIKDTLEFSYLGYRTQKIIINKSHFGIIVFEVKLQKEAITLDVVNIKRHNLSGQLVSDVNKVKLKKGGNFTKELKLPFPNAKAATYEQRKMNTIGGGGIIGGVYGLLSGEKKKIKKMLKAKRTEEDLIRLEKKYGFYVLDDLKIRKENVSRFFYFCYKSKGFNESKSKIIELMKFMKIKSKEFKELNP